MNNSLSKIGSKATGENWRDNWISPPWLIDLVNEFYRNEWFDPCPVNPDFDGLSISWKNRNLYINPPFSAHREWVKAAYLKKRGHGEILYLANTDSSTNWFERLILPSSAICLFRKRICFLHPETGEVFKQQSKCQILFYIGDRVNDFAKVFRGVGYIMEPRFFNPMEEKLL